MEKLIQLNATIVGVVTKRKSLFNSDWTDLEPICQKNNIVPIVEPEVLMDGDHSIERCMEVTKNTLKVVFDYLSSKTENTLTCRGFGETKPLVPNESANSRMTNRRTSFVIIQ